MSTRAMVIGGTITLYSYLDHDDPKKPARVYVNAVLPAAVAKDWEGTILSLINWKITNDRVMLTYQTRDDVYAGIFDTEFPVEHQRIDLTPPNRSRNWEFHTFDDTWRNRKTGERVLA